MSECYARYTRAELNDKLRRELAALERGSGSAAERIAHEHSARHLELELLLRETRAAASSREAAPVFSGEGQATAPNGTLYLDGKCYIAGLDARAVAWLKVSQQDVSGKSLEALVHRADRWKVVRLLEQIRTERLPAMTEVRLVTNDAISVRFETGRRVSDPDLAPGPLVEVHLADVSTRRQAETDARRHIGAVSRAARFNALAEMASGVAHELSQPLSAIVAYARAGRHLLELQGADARGEVEQSLEKIAQQAERAGEVIRRIRGFVHKEQPRCSAHTVLELLRLALSIVDDEIRDADVSVRVEEQAPDLAVWVDAIFIEQVMVNLLRNAVEAMQATASGAPEIVVRIARTDPQWIEVSFEDSGETIAEQDTEQWFMPFSTSRHGNLGLGLSLSRSLVEAHGGRLWAEPGGERGALLRFTMPGAPA